jgi:hypothetical protein
MVQRVMRRSRASRAGRGCCQLTLVVALTLLAGCSVARVNLRLEAIEVFDSTPDAVLKDMWGWKPDGKVVKLLLSSDQSIRELSSRYGLHVHVDAYSCSNPALELAYMNRLFDDEGPITQEAPPKAVHSGQYRFSFYFADRSSRKAANEQKPTYDLVQDPMNVCLRLSARNMGLQGFTSNVVSVQAERLAEMLTKS